MSAAVAGVSPWGHALSGIPVFDASGYPVGEPPPSLPPPPPEVSPPVELDGAPPDSAPPPPSSEVAPPLPVAPASAVSESALVQLEERTPRRRIAGERRRR